MRRNFALIAALLLPLLATAPAMAQCTGSPAAGRVCANPAAAPTLPAWSTVTALLDRAFAGASGQVLNRGASVWTSTSTPTLGIPGTTGGAITLAGLTSGAVSIRTANAAGSWNFTLPTTPGTVGFVLITDGAGNTSWANNAAGGTVQSVGLSMPGIFSVSGSPVTTTGTLTASLATQSANLVWAGPTSGGAATPAFRALVGADLPNPSASTLGGVQSFAAVSSQWIRQISTSGVPTASQPAFTDISGTLAAAQCPNPGASSLGCIQSLAAVASRWINTISTSGVPSATQPAFTDISGNAALAQLPLIGNNSILGNVSGGTTVPSAITATNILDILGSTQGQILYRNASAWVPLSPGTSGQVLTTGGAAANPAWATVSGTGTVTTLTSGTGILFSSGATCTTTCTVSLNTIANNTLLANVSGGALAPSSTTPTLVLDIIGSTQGNILYRAAGNWTVLAPGTNGQVLTMGASTPAWATAGSVTNVTIAAGTGISISGTCTITTTGTCTITNSGVVTVKKQVFTANGTYTPSTGMKYALLECQGSGGGGGGVTGTAGSVFAAGGGGAGSWSKILVTAADIGASKAVVIGAAGAGGTAGSNNGTAGGDAGVGVLCVGKGGAAGGFSASGTFGSGGAGGVAGTGDLAPPGGRGSPGQLASISTVFIMGGDGGNAFYGAGGKQSVSVSGTASAGIAATGFGGGGSGALAHNTAGTAAGGDGSKGVVYITEYNSQ